MIPQLVVTAWLTLTCVLLGVFFYKECDEEGSIVIAIVYTVIPIVALWYADFWIIK